MENVDLKRQALKAMRVLLRQFVRAEIEAADFVPKYGVLFAPFDPPDLKSKDLNEIERKELDLYILLMGGWFGEHEDLVPKRPDWQYGKDLEPYGWIDAPGYRQWILEAVRNAGIQLP